MQDINVVGPWQREPAERWTLIDPMTADILNHEV